MVNMPSFEEQHALNSAIRRVRSYAAESRLRYAALDAEDFPNGKIWWSYPWLADKRRAYRLALALWHGRDAAATAFSSCCVYMPSHLSYRFDVFRDEGVNFYRRLLQAGVPASAREVCGTVHASDLHFHMIPEVAAASARAIADFASGGAVLEARMGLPPPVPMPMPKSKL